MESLGKFFKLLSGQAARETEQARLAKQAEEIRLKPQQAAQEKARLAQEQVQMTARAKAGSLERVQRATEVIPQTIAGLETIRAPIHLQAEAALRTKVNGDSKDYWQVAVTEGKLSWMSVQDIHHSLPIGSEHSHSPYPLFVAVGPALGYLNIHILSRNPQFIRRDITGQPIIDSREFSIQEDQVPSTSISYLDLYRQVDPYDVGLDKIASMNLEDAKQALPTPYTHTTYKDNEREGAGVLIKDLPSLKFEVEPNKSQERIIQDVDQFASEVGFEFLAGVAASLTEVNIGFLGSEAAGVVPQAEEALKRFDAITALLPSGYRSNLSVATWASSFVRHHFNLCFTNSEKPENNQFGVKWGENPVGKVALGEDALTYYYTLLGIQKELGTESLVRFLAAKTDPQPVFNPAQTLSVFP